MTRRIDDLARLSMLAALWAVLFSGCGVEGGRVESKSGDVGAAEEGTAGNPAIDDAAYLHRLGLIQGHLIAFMELYRAGAVDAAMTHAKHPESELYADLVPAFEARGAAGFADELSALVAAAQNGGDIEAAYEAVKRKIRANTPKVSLATRLTAVSRMVRTAADEFDIAVEEDGSITNAHEYQDAYGFLSAAREILTAAGPGDADEINAVNIAREQIDAALEGFSDLAAERTDAAAATLYGAAARVEAAALSAR